MLVDPAPSPKPLTPTEEDSLLQMAARARADGQHWRAHTLAEQAYAGRRSLSTLLYLIGIRVDELGEATFGAAAYHTMLRVLPLRDDERAKANRTWAALREAKASPAMEFIRAISFSMKAAWRRSMAQVWSAVALASGAR